MVDRARSLHENIMDPDGNMEKQEPDTEAKTGAGLKQSQLEDIIENALECICRLDHQGHFLSVNNRFAETCGYSVDQMIGMAWVEAVHADDHAKAQELYQQMLDDGRSEGELRGLRADGTEFDMLLVIVRGLKRIESSVDCYCFMQDISIPEPANDGASQQAGNFSQSLLPIFIVRDSDSCIVEANNVAVQLSGYAPAELKQRKLSELNLFADNKDPKNFSADLITCDDFVDRDALLRCANQELVPVSLSKSVVPLDGQLHFLLLARNLQRQYERESTYQQIIEAVTSIPGENFFEDAVRLLTEKLGVRYALVTECLDDPVNQVCTLAFSDQGQLQPMNVYDLDGTPCEAVIKGKSVFFSEQVQKSFPEDEELVRMGAESFVGEPLLDSTGKTIGHFALIDTRPLEDAEFYRSLLRVFSSRAAVEVERERQFRLLTEVKDKYANAINLCPDAIAITRLDNGEIIDLNEGFCRMIGLPRDKLLGQSVEDLLFDSPQQRELFLRRLRKKGVINGVERSATDAKGRLRYWLQSSTVMQVDNETCLFSIGQDITERKQQELLRDIRYRVFEAITTNQTLPATLELIASSSEQIGYKLRCSILLLDSNGYTLRLGAAPSLPQEILTLLDGFDTRLGKGTCSHAVQTGQRIITPDIELDENWTDFLQTARKYSIRSCWSQPIFTSDEKIIGTFAIYYPEVREPDSFDIELIQTQAYLASIAIEKHCSTSSIEQQRNILESFFNTGAESILVAELYEGRILEINHGFEQLTGYSRANVIGKTTLEIGLWKNPQDRELYVEQLEKNGVIENWECQLRIYDNSIVTVLLSSSLLVIEGKQCVMSIGRDITEWQQTRLALEKSEQKFRDAFGKAPNGVALIDKSGNFFQSNDSLVRLLGFPSGTTESINLFHLTYPKDVFKCKKAFNDLIASANREMRIENRFIAQDRGVIWTEIYASPVMDAHGLFMFAVVHIIDITERVLADYRFTRSKRALQVLNDCNHGLVKINNESNLLQYFCEVIVDTGQYRMAWIGYAHDDEQKTVKPVASAGFEDGYLQHAFSWSETASGQEPVGLSIRGLTPCISRNIFTDNKMRKWRDEAIKRGYESLASFPIIINSQVIGVLVLYSGSVDAFDTEEVNLLHDLTTNLSRGIQNLRIKHEHDLDRVKLAESEKQFRDLYHDTPSMFFTVDMTGKILSVNEYGARELGYKINELIGESIRLIVHPDDISAVTEYFQQHEKRRDDVKRIEFRKVKHDGTVIWVRETVRFIQEDENESRFFIVCEDITEIHRLSNQLSWQASHDALTGLVNRVEFERRLERVLHSSAASGEDHALCFLDLDQFKVINDTCGHLAGDELLRQISEVLSATVRKRDTVARLGGDEFGILMEHCSLEKAQEVSNTILNRISDFRFTWEDKRFSLGMSIGLVPISSGDQTITAVLRQADAACYAAKEAGRNRIHVYNVEDKDVSRIHGEMQWVSIINEAIEDNQLVLYTQKIQPLYKTIAGGEHHELLIRLRAADGHIVMPGAFMPAAERYNLSTKIDSWVLRRYFHWLKENEEKLDQLSICSINLSGLSVSNIKFVDEVLELFQRYQIPGDKNCFEITETAAIQNMSHAIKFMQMLRGIGCSFALDDFGSGVSSFAYLKQMPVDYIKIDGSFVRDIMTDRLDFEMVRSISDIARVMGIQTIAEFVETQYVLRLLKGLGVNFAQGYAIHKPEPLFDIDI